jgi:hypothetical protein
LITFTGASPPRFVVKTSGVIGVGRGETVGLLTFAGASPPRFVVKTSGAVGAGRAETVGLLTFTVASPPRFAVKTSGAVGAGRGKAVGALTFAGVLTSGFVVKTSGAIGAGWDGRTGFVATGTGGVDGRGDIRDVVFLRSTLVGLPSAASGSFTFLTRARFCGTFAAETSGAGCAATAPVMVGCSGVA